MNKTLKIIIPISIIILALAGIVILKSVVSKQHIIDSNDPYAVGAMCGNIYNSGLFAEESELVYFSNAYDGGALYVMNSDQTNVRRIASGNISYINVLNGYAYYFSSTSGDQAGLGYVRNGRGLYRTDSNGKSTFAMTKCTTDGMMLIGDYLYFLDFEEGSNNNAHVTLNKVSINNENFEELLDEHIHLGGYSNGKIYYGGVTEDHHLHTFDISTGATEDISNINVYMPVIQGDKVYYLDLDNDYHLTVMNLSDGFKQDLSGERVDTYNIYENVIYYQNCDPNAYALKRINVDGTGLETVQKGVYRNINVTSTFTYFQEFGNDLPIYFTPTTGSINVTNFDAARDAALAVR